MTVAAAAKRYLLAPLSPTRLGVTRCVLCLYLLLDRVGGDLHVCLISSRRALGFMDPSIAHWLPIPFPLPPLWHTPISVLFHLFALTAAVGLFTRLSLASFTLLYLYVGSINSSWGWFNHTPAIAVQVLIALTLLPGSTSWSLDRALQWWWHRRRGRSVGTLRTFLRGPPVPAYALNVVVSVMVAVYLATGVAKLRFSGPEWLEGDTLGFSLTNKIHGPLYVGARRAPPQDTWRDGFGVGHWVYQASPIALGQRMGKIKPLMALLAVFTICFEMLAPLALRGPRARTIYFLFALLFHLGILATMQIHFTTWMVIGACLIDWRLVASWLRRPFRRKPV